MMNKLKKKNESSAINFEQVKAGLELFSARLKDMMGNLVKYMADDKEASARKCEECGVIIARDARFCPSCGTALTV